MPLLLRRLRGKQTVVPAGVGPRAQGIAMGVAAVEHEARAADGLLALPLDGRRRHIHYTHVCTSGAHDVQPHQMSREAFWEHLAKCYQEAYPRADSETGSILQFGVVCRETT